MRAALAYALMAASAVSAQAQSAAPREQIYDLATIEAAHDICGFPLSDEQADILDKRREAAVEGDGIPAAEVAAMADEIRASLKRQVPEGLCKPDGAEARLYKRKLAEYGLL